MTLELICHFEYMMLWGQVRPQENRLVSDPSGNHLLLGQNVYYLTSWWKVIGGLWQLQWETGCREVYGVALKTSPLLWPLALCRGRLHGNADMSVNIQYAGQVLSNIQVNSKKPTFLYADFKSCFAILLYLPARPRHATLIPNPIGCHLGLL